MRKIRCKPGISFLLTMTIHLVVCENIYPQANGDYRTIQNGIWSIASNWEVYNSGNWIPALNSPSQQDGQINVRHTMQISADQVIDQTLVDTGATINIQQGVMVTVTNSPATIELNVKGTMTNSGMLFFSPSSIMLVDSGATYIHNSSIASSSVLDASQLHTQSNWVYRGNGTLAPPVAFSNRHYGHLIFESSAGSWNRTISGSSPASCTSLKIDQGVMIINNYMGILSIHGNIILNGTFVNGTGTQRILLDGSTGKLAGNTLTNFFDTLTVQLASLYTLESNMTTSPYSSFMVRGLLDCKTYTIDGNTNGSTFSLAADAWLKTSHLSGITASITGFNSNNFNDNANYEFSGNTTQLVNFHNSFMKNLTINSPTGALLTLKNNFINISGTLNMIEGIFSIDSNTINFSGTSLQGQVQNMVSTAFSSLYFTGSDSGVFIPASINILKNLYINKLSNHVRLQGNLRVLQSLILQKGNLNAATHSVSAEGNPGDGIVGGTDSSFVDGNLIRKIPMGDSLNIFYPVGKTNFHPLFFKNLTAISSTNLKVSVDELIPSGSADGISLLGNMMNRYWNIKSSGINGIVNVDTVELTPYSPVPALQSSSKIGVSIDNTTFSYHGIGGIHHVNSISSTRNFSTCQLDDLNSTDGIFLGITDFGSASGIYNDSLCTPILRIKAFLQGFYVGNRMLNATVDPLMQPNVCDTIQVNLYNEAAPYNLEHSFITTISTTGNIEINLPANFNRSFYLSLKHRNCLETWSSSPLLFNNSTISYDFSDSQINAYGNNLTEVSPGIFALYSGDISCGTNNSQSIQDGIIDTIDFIKMENDILLFSTGYSNSDLTGDNITDISDYSLLENNLSQGLQVIRP